LLSRKKNSPTQIRVTEIDLRAEPRCAVSRVQYWPAPNSLSPCEDPARKRRMHLLHPTVVILIQFLQTRPACRIAALALPVLITCQADSVLV